MSRLKVIVADDHPLMLRGIRRALEAPGDIEVVAEARTGAEVIPLARRYSPDVVLLDARMPQMDGWSCLEILRRTHPKIKVIVMSVSNDSAQIEQAVKRGASGYIVKSVNPVDLPAAVRQVADGTVYHALYFNGRDRDAGAKAVGLTDREVSILKAVAVGLSNKAIAEELSLTEPAIKFHLTRIYRKIGVSNRTGAARYAFQTGLAAAGVLETV
jgi:DNA-binding NarL/FixJ family response regulator